MRYNRPPPILTWWLPSCQVASGEHPGRVLAHHPPPLDPLCPLPREVSDMQRAKSFRSSRAQITYSMSTMWGTVELLEMQKGSQSLRALPLWLARDVTCKGSSLDISSSQYFLFWISAQWIFSSLDICTVKDWCMNASFPLNWTEASHWDRANMEGSRSRNINQQFVISILTSDFSECIILIIRGQHNHEDI